MSNTSGLNGKARIVNGQDGIKTLRFPATASTSQIVKGLDPSMVYIAIVSLAGPSSMQMQLGFDSRGLDDLGVGSALTTAHTFEASGNYFVGDIAQCTSARFVVAKTAGTDDQTLVGKIGARAEIRLLPVPVKLYDGLGMADGDPLTPYPADWESQGGNE